MAKLELNVAGIQYFLQRFQYFSFDYQGADIAGLGTFCLAVSPALEGTVFFTVGAGADSGG